MKPTQPNQRCRKTMSTPLYKYLAIESYHRLRQIMRHAKLHPTPPRLKFASDLLTVFTRPSFSLGWHPFLGQIAFSEISVLTWELLRVLWTFFTLCGWWHVDMIDTAIIGYVWFCFRILVGLNHAILFSLIVCGQTHIGNRVAAIPNGRATF